MPCKLVGYFISRFRPGQIQDDRESRDAKVLSQLRRDCGQSFGASGHENQAESL